MRSDEDVAQLRTLNIPYLVARCLDIDLENKVERVHALRLARKLMVLSPGLFPEALARAVAAVAEEDNKEKDKLRSSCLAMLCELSKIHCFIMLLIFD